MEEKLKIKSFALLGALALLVGCASSANRNDPAADTAVASQDGDSHVEVIETAAVPDSQKIRCITEAVTGSRIGQRVCRTEAEWERIRQASQDYTRAMQGPLTDPGEP